MGVVRRQGRRDIQWQKPRPRGTSAYSQAPESPRGPGSWRRKERMSEGVSRDQEELPEENSGPTGWEAGLRVVSLVPGEISSSGVGGRA